MEEIFNGCFQQLKKLTGIIRWNKYKNLSEFSKKETADSLEIDGFLALGEKSCSYLNGYSKSNKKGKKCETLEGQSEKEHSKM